MESLGWSNQGYHLIRARVHPREIYISHGRLYAGMYLSEARPRGLFPDVSKPRVNVPIPAPLF